MASSTPVPDTIGRFRIEARLGAGGMGEVYKGFDPALKRSVAVKTVRPGLGGQEYVDRLYREAQACAALQHPHIVTIYEVGEFDGGVFIAMEFLKGHNLATLIELGALTLRQRLSILDQVLDALAHAHAEQVVHRDIKPSNVHVLPDGSIKLLDFGLARMETADTITMSGAVMGTPHYASPEQLRAERVDARSDIFSTGAMAYELFEGRRPFEADTISAVLIKVLTEPPAPVCGDWSRQCPALESVVQRAMAKSPADRYQSAAEMQQALAEVSGAERAAIEAFDAAHPARPMPVAPLVTAVPDDPTAVRTSVSGAAASATRITAPAGSPIATASAATAVTATFDDATRISRATGSAPAPEASSAGRSTLVYAAAALAALVVIAVGYRQFAPAPPQDVSSPVASTGSVAPPVPGSTPAASTTPAATVPPPAPETPSVPATTSRVATPSATNGAAASTLSARGAAPVAAAGTDAAAGASALPAAVRLFGDAAAKNAGLKWRVVRKLDSGEEVDVDPDQTFHSGDRVRLVFESNIDGYLYVATQGSSKRWTLLFPGETINGGSNAVARGTMLEVPNNGWFRFDDTPGQEELFVVLSRERLADLPGFQGRVRRNESNLPTKAVDDLRLRLASRDLVFEKDPAPPKGMAQPGRTLAQYVVNRDELAKAVSATITLKHAQ